MHIYHLHHGPNHVTIMYSLNLSYDVSAFMFWGKAFRYLLQHSTFPKISLGLTLALVLIETRNNKRLNNRAYSLFFLMVIFLKHPWLIPNILKWKDCKIFTKLVLLQTPSRSNHQRCSVKIGVLKNLGNFTGKHLYWSLFLIKLQIFRPAALLRRDSNTGFFLWNLWNFSEHLFWRTAANGCFYPSYGLQNLIITSSSDFRGDIVFCIIT